MNQNPRDIQRKVRIFQYAEVITNSAAYRFFFLANIGHVFSVHGLNAITAGRLFNLSRSKIAFSDG